MALGQAITEDFVLLLKNPDAVVPVLDIPETNRQCCFQLGVLAEIDGTDDLKNDKSSKFFFFDEGYTGAIMILKKQVNGEYENVVVLSDTAFGEYYPYGFATNSRGEKMMGYVLDWKLVLEAHGEGSYMIEALADTFTGGEKSFFSYEYCLLTYKPHRAEKTVRISFWQTGVMGNINDDAETIDFGDFTAFGQIRLPDSYFGNDTSNYEDSYVRYANGQQKWLTDSQDQFLELECRKLPAYLHDHLRSDILQADRILITDYNSRNPNKNLINKYVRRNSGYEPRWHRGSMYAPVTIKFMKEFKNFIHKRC